jgi:dihydropyrimidinase
MKSSEFDLVVRNARVATASDIFESDIAIRDGKIVQLGANLPAGAREYDAAGRVVTPGGIDAHCHLDQPMEPPVRMADNFDSGTRAAACGGTTTVIPFAAQAKGQSLRAAVEDYHRRADGKAHVDYGFHMIVSDPTPEVLEKELPQLIREGYTSFKIYMTYDDLKLNDGQILDVLDVARKYDATAMIHAENADCIQWLTKRLEASGRSAPRYHAVSRPMLVEREATHRAIALSELADVPILIVHVSGREAVEQIRWARSHGMNIMAETCPQYLFQRRGSGHRRQLSGRQVRVQPTAARSGQPGSDLERAERRPVHRVLLGPCAVQLRFTRRQEAQWRGGVLGHIPNGIPGIETRLSLLYTHGVLTGRMTLNRFVELTSTNPAKVYGLHPRKGSIAIGADADLVVWQEGERAISNRDLHHNVDYTPYEGQQLKAWPCLTLSAGQVVWDGEQFHARAGSGRFLQRGAPTLLPKRHQARF